MSSEVQQTTSYEVQQLWHKRCADLKLRNTQQEIKRIGLIYDMACVDLLDLIRVKLPTIPPSNSRLG